MRWFILILMTLLMASEARSPLRHLTALPPPLPSDSPSNSSTHKSASTFPHVFRSPQRQRLNHSIDN